MKRSLTSYRWVSPQRRRRSDRVFGGIRRARCGLARGRGRGAMLLEVLISIAIIVLAITTIGGMVGQSLKTAEFTNNLNRALMLAEWALAEMDLGSYDDEDRLIDMTGEEGEGTFGETYPGFGWRITREPTDVEDLDLITLEILQGNPEEDSVGDWRLLHTVYAYRPVVAELDPADFGMPSEDEIGQFASASLPTEGGTDAMGDATEMITEELLALLPAPVQDITQRFLSGESVPLDEIRAAFGELTTEDFLGMMTMPSVLGMLGGNMEALTEQFMGAQGLAGVGGGQDLGGLLGLGALGSGGGKLPPLGDLLSGGLPGLGKLGGGGGLPGGLDPQGLRGALQGMSREDLQSALDAASDEQLEQIAPGMSREDLQSALEGTSDEDLRSALDGVSPRDIRRALRGGGGQEGDEGRGGRRGRRGGGRFRNR